MLKPTLIPMNLQLFAEETDGADAGTDVDLDGGSQDDGNFDLSALLGDTGQGTEEQQDDEQQAQTGGEKTFTQADLDRIVGERLSRERQKSQGKDENQQYLESLQQFGWTLPEIVAHLEQQTLQQQQEQLQEQADQYGVSPEFVQRLTATEQELATYRQTEQQRMIDNEVSRLSGDKEFGSFFTEHKQEIFDTAIQSKTDLETAMSKLFVKKYPEIKQQLSQAGQQQAIRQIQQRGALQVDSGTQSGESGAGVEISADQMAMLKALGVNPKDAVKHMKKK